MNPRKIKPARCAAARPWLLAPCLALALQGAATALSPIEPPGPPLVPFDFPVRPGEQQATCTFGTLQLPADTVVLAAGAYGGRPAGFQIDQSGHAATRMDVAVHSPGQPVALVLGAYEPTVWHIGWSDGTRIVAVLVSGYHRQAVAGLVPGTPLLNSSYSNQGPCGHFYVSDDAAQLRKLNATASALFGQSVRMVYPARDGRVVVGNALTPGVRLTTSPAVTPESFKDDSAPLAGRAGIDDLVRKGLLRPATAADADAWAQQAALAAPSDLPAVEGAPDAALRRPAWRDAYVVLGPMRYPAGLYGAHAVTFVVPRGLPRPTGNPGHSDVYDFNTLACAGPGCSAR
ncbi:MAG: hypothetical protein Q4G71_10895 [Pseudomonadota bacterium]|nr:hypothetical protein [Pseudomonadota bacterium]